MYKVIKKDICYIIVSCILFGIVAHGFFMMNNFVFHDAIGSFWGESPIIVLSGRWLLALLEYAMEIIQGGSNYQTPLFFGVVTFLFVSVIIYLIVKVLGIKDKKYIVILSGYMVVFPSITSLFFYMYTAPFYMVGYLICLIGSCLVYYARINKNIKEYVIGIILLVSSIGIYQANLSIAISFILLCLIKDMIELREGLTIKKLVSLCIYFVVTLILSLILYLIITKITMIVLQKELWDYAGINSFGVTSINGYVKRIAKAYREFLCPTSDARTNMYPTFAMVLYKMMLILSMILTGLMSIYLYRKSIVNMVAYIMFVLVLPLACNFIYVINDESAYGITLYSEVFFAIYVVYMLKHKEVLCDINKKISLILTRSLMILIGMLVIFFCKFDNDCYLKADILQKQEISYYTNLISSIKNCDGYTDEKRIVWVGEFNKTDKSMTRYDQFEKTNILPLNNLDEIINDYLWRKDLKLLCGFDPIVEEYDEDKHKDEIKEMPCYPDRGSIKCVEDYIIVKFAEP